MFMLAQKKLHKQPTAFSTNIYCINRCLVHGVQHCQHLLPRQTCGSMDERLWLSIYEATQD